MNTIQIKADAFFELLKMQDTSMWEIFAQMIDGTAKKIVFLAEGDQVLFTYNLPASLEQLHEDRKEFAREFAEKLAGFN